MYEEEPSHQSIKEIKEMVSCITPGLKTQIHVYLYERFWSTSTLFNTPGINESNQDKGLIPFLLERIQVAYFRPESVVIQQYDAPSRVYITGESKCKVRIEYDLSS